MKTLFYAADKYLKQSNWKDLTLIKFCLFSMGLICGMQIKDKYKKHFSAGAFIVFIVTYVPLMLKFIPMLQNAFRQTSLEKEINAKYE